MTNFSWVAGFSDIVTWYPHLLEQEIPLPVEAMTPADFLQRRKANGPQGNKHNYRTARYGPESAGSNS
jgi:hypothetical protein